MGAFTEYNAFSTGHSADCQALGLTPRQVMILSVAMLAFRKKGNDKESDGGKVHFPLTLPDRSILRDDDCELYDLMTDEKPYLKWGDSGRRSFEMTNQGVELIKRIP